jgi:xylulose-5-phosphate/fructose-6-phosphate phosphoketolase
LSQAYLEGTYSEIYPEKSEDAAGLQRFFKQFSFPGGIGSHATPETPGSIHEGGELGYSISHAYGAAYDHPDLIALVMVGDGESETGPLATSWHSNKFLNPITDGAALPIDLVRPSGFRPEYGVRNGLTAGGKRIRTIGPSRVRIGPLLPKGMP